MKWTTTDPRTGSGLAASVGDVVGYISGGTLTTLAKSGTATTDWAVIPSTMPAPPMSQSRCDVATTDPRTAGRAAKLDTVVLYYTAGTGLYLIKYGTGDTQWVPLPGAVTSGGGGATLPIAESDVTNLPADLATLTAAVATKADKSITINISPGSGGGDLTANRTLVPATNSTSSAGIVSQAPNDTSKFYRGDATWARLSAWAWMFGAGTDGSPHFDGVATITLGDGTTVAPSGGNYTLPRDCSFDSVTIDTGVIVFAHGLRVHAKTGIFGLGTISVRGNAGGNATGSTVSGAAGAAIPDKTFKGVSAGVIGGSALPSANSNNAPLGISLTPPASLVVGNGANGTVGNGGVGGSGGFANGGAVGVNMVGPGTVTLMLTSTGGPVLDAPPALFTGRGAGTTTQYTWGTAGTAGRGGNGSQPGRGGGSGTAGGAIYIAALTIDATITIDARGGAGGNGGGATGGFGGGGGAGAGGGPGGVVMLVQGYGALPTIDISGGLGGTGGAGDPNSGGAPPSPGGPGYSGGNGGDGLKFAYLLTA